MPHEVSLSHLLVNTARIVAQLKNRSPLRPSTVTAINRRTVITSFHIALKQELPISRVKDTCLAALIVGRNSGLNQDNSRQDGMWKARQSPLKIVGRFNRNPRWEWLPRKQTRAVKSSTAWIHRSVLLLTLTL